MISQSPRPMFYRAAYWCHHWWPTMCGVLFVLLGIWAVVEIWAYGWNVRAETAWLRRILLAIAALAFLAVVALRLFAFWHSILLRYLAWWTAQAAGWAWRWSTSGWRLAGLFVLGVVLAWREAPRLTTGRPMPWLELLTAENTVKIFVVVILLTVVYQGYQARRRMTILAFSNYAGEKYKSFVDGLPARLLNELQRLGDLYKVIDEANPSPQARRADGRGGTAIGVTVSVEDIGESLRGAISADTKVKLWGMEVPIGALVGAFARFVRGPRLSGSLHRDGQRLVLVAGIDGKAFSGSWHVDTELSRSPLSEGAELPLESMLTELVYRVFTDLVSVGSHRWRAVRCYSEGLQTFRRTLGTARERDTRLAGAEKLFIQAAAEDDTFARCHYNLGVVYQSLENDESARAAFERALAEDRTLVKAALALATQYWKTQDFISARNFAERAIDMDAADARPWQIMGMAQLLGKEVALERPLLPGLDAAHWPDIIETCEIAVACAWRSLCRAAFCGENLDSIRPTVERCLGDLAISLIMAAQPRRGRSILRQALNQTRDSSHYFMMGLSWTMGLGRRGPDYAKAAQAYRSALLVDDRVVYWAFLAEAKAGQFADSKDVAARKDARDAFARAMRCPSKLTATECDRLAAACRSLAETDRALDNAEAAAWDDELAIRAATVATVLAELEQPQDRGAWIESLRGRLVQLDDYLVEKPGWGWPYAMVAKSLASAQGDEDPAATEQLLRTALDRLAPDHPEEVVQQQLRLRLADALLAQKKRDEARDLAMEAVASNPLAADERRQLADVYYEMSDHERADKQLQLSYELDPTEPRTLELIARSHLTRGLGLRNRQERREAFLRGIKTFGDTVAAIEAAKQMRDARAWGAMHFWKGRLHAELRQTDLAIYHLRIALTAAFKPLETRLILAWIYIRDQVYNDAENILVELMEETAKRANGGPAASTAAADTHEEMALEELILRGHLFLAAVYTERGPDVAQAEEHLSSAFSLLPLVQKALLPLVQKRADAVQIEAGYYDCRGWLDYQMGRTTTALKHLEHAARLTSEAENYYHLAVVCLELAESRKKGRRRWLRLTATYCRQARAEDFPDALTSRIDDIEKRLARATG